MNRSTYILISTHICHNPRWQNWLELHSANSMVVGSNPAACYSKFCCFFILALPFFLLFPPFSLPSQRNFPISFKPKVAIVEFFQKMQRKVWYSILRVDAMPPSLKNLLFNPSIIFFLPGLCICHHPFQSKFFICRSKFD